MRLLALMTIMLELVWGRLDELDEFDRMMAEPKDRSAWVDPLDMGMYDSNQVNCPEVVDRLDRCEKDLVICQKNIERTAMIELNTTTVQPDVEKKPVQVKTATEIFLKRHVSQLISKLGLTIDTSAHLKLEIQLSQFQVQTLQNFVSLNSGIHAVDVDHILSSFIKSVETYERSPWIETIKDKIILLKDPLLVLIMAIALVYLVFMVLRRMPPFKIFLLVLVVSVVWHWVHMYKATWATKHSKLLQNNIIPAECRPQDMTWFQTIQSSASSVFSSVDKCEEYHKAILVDPIYEVNPLTAVVDLITKLLLHPLSSLGKEVGSMFTGLLGSVPFFWKIPVLLVFVVLLMFIMILIAGYRVRLPMFLGEIGPANLSSDIHLHQALEEIKDLKNIICQNAALDGGSDNLMLDAQVKDSGSVRCQISGVEELVPLGYDCHEKSHKDEKLISRPSSGTPKKEKLSLKSISLTPVKGRVLSQPEIYQKPLNLVTSDTNTPYEVRDLARKRSDNLPKSPVKNLVAEGCNSPKSTKFEWMSTADTEDETVVTDFGDHLTKEQFISESEDIIALNVNRSVDHLNKIEEIFKKPIGEEG